MLEVNDLDDDLGGGDPGRDDSGAAGQVQASSRDAEGAEPVPIAEAARLTGVTAHTLRYYERAGLLVRPLDRTGGGHRVYHPADLAWIVVCTRLRATGMPVDAIRRYAELVAAGPGNEGRRFEILQAHRSRTITRMAELRQGLALLDRKIGVYRRALADDTAATLWASGGPGEPSQEGAHASGHGRR